MRNKSGKYAPWMLKAILKAKPVHGFTLGGRKYITTNPKSTVTNLERMRMIRRRRIAEGLTTHGVPRRTKQRGNPPHKEYMRIWRAERNHGKERQVE